MTVMIEKLAINVNGAEKYATGLTKTTTIDDLKFAMLTTTLKNNTDLDGDELNMDNYGVFERWQGNERLLDGRVKIYKLIRVWQSLPGDQLSHVQFFIKRKKPIVTSSNAYKQLPQQHKLSNRCKNVPAAAAAAAATFALCTLSPNMDKTWNHEKMARKSAYVNRQLRLVATANACEKSTCSTDSVNDDDSSEAENALVDSRRRYASIKRYHRSKRSTIKKCNQIKSAYIDLVDKQNDIIAKQLEELSREQSESSSSTPTDDVQLNQLFGDYVDIEICLEQKLAKIEQLKTELKSLIQDKQRDLSTVSSSSKLAKTNKRLHACIELEKRQADTMKSMESALEHIDDIITLKQKSVETLERELERLEELILTNPTQPVYSMSLSMPPRIAKSTSTSSTTSSSKSSTSSLLTSISSISTQSSVSNLHQSAVANRSSQSYVGNCDNESDTGISSANSDDFSTQLETLV